MAVNALWSKVPWSLVLTIRSIPKDPGWLRRWFEADLASGRIESPLDVRDVWPENYSTNSVQKVWAAKFTARHPNLVALEISSFKCGHDAPIYGVIEGIIEQSGTPYFCFKDLDENKPTGSIRIRVETIDYFLRRYREEVIRKRKAAEDIEAQLVALEAELRRERGPSSEVEGESEAPVFANTEATREIQEMAAD